MFGGTVVAGLLPVVGVYKMTTLLPLARDDPVLFRVFAVVGMGVSLIGAKVIRDASVKVYDRATVHFH